ncbi:hypothetical protein FNT36_14215 [Hymenobacter setariae]|uniref:PH domain-containing protein n=1 Tax=Hymenobacter setariae TaxID=2594794 RepID=A0A558BVR2_9BACT|nr:hypothetical protein [Hymenobacter setariae]TVT40620.1 hypothetical protein FNT36_14215 [Hymenobacter setariae]
MPAHSPITPDSRPGLRSLVVLNPLSMLAAGMFLFGLLLVPLAALKAIEGNWQRATTAGLLGLVLLLLTARKVARRNRPMLLTSDRDGLHLAPLGRSLTHGIAAETIPIASIKAYRYCLRVMRWQAFAQCHLRLELADGRVLHLADRSGSRPDDPTGTVQLDAVARRLARRKTGPLRRLPFFSTRPARMLLWVSGMAVVAGVGLLWLGFAVGVLLLLLGVGYAASYYLGHGAADIATY